MGVYSHYMKLSVSAFGLFFASIGTAQAQLSPSQASPNAVQITGKTETPSQSAIGLSTNLQSSSAFTDNRFIGLSPTLRGALLDIPTGDMSLLNIDFTGSGCFTDDSACLSQELDFSEIGYSAPKYVKLNSKGLDLELTPSAAFRFDNDSSSAALGAYLRIGDDLRKSPDFTNNKWYFFAGADAEALTYRPNSTEGPVRGTFNLQDRIIVGDAQAGVGYRIGDADVSLSYMRRAVSGLSTKDIAEETAYKEDAATLSFTWRR